MNAVATRHCPLWMQLVMIFSASHQNQLAMVEARSPSHILSCMHLAILADSDDFQQHGWTALANVVATPISPGKKVHRAITVLV